MSTVVAVGDNMESLTRVSRRVIAMGHEVSATACSYGQAKELARRLGPDAILIDCPSGAALDAIVSELDAETESRSVAVILVAGEAAVEPLKTKLLPPFVGIITPRGDADSGAAFARARESTTALTHEFRSMDLYKTIAATSPDGIIVMALDGATLYSSPRALEMFGSESEEAVMGSDAVGLLAPEDRARARADLSRVAIGESVRNVVYTAERGDASRFVCEVSGSPIRNDRGEPVAVVVVVRDCSRRVESELELEYASRRFRALVERSSDITLIIDRGMKISYASSSMRAILGYEPDELVGTEALSFVHADDADAALAIFSLIDKAGGDLPQIIIRIRHADGSWRNLEASLTDGHDDPAVDGLLLNCRDVTDRIESEKENRAILKRLMRAQKLEAVGQLAAGVAHDFNNLLTAIDGYAEITIGKLPPGAPGRSEVEQIAKISRRAAELTRQLLIVGRDQATVMKPMDLNHNIEEVLGLLDRTIGETIEVSFRPETELWTVTADTSNIGQVMMNLAMNARKAMPDGGTIAVSTENVDVGPDDVRRIPGAREGRFVRMSVRDTGNGIEPDVIDHIFEPFYTTRDESGGAGMGLAVVQGIVDQHNGWICVRSEPGTGTEFDIYLPASPDSSAVGVFENAPRVSVERGDGKRILLVEDDEMIRRLFRNALSDHGYQVVDAGDVEEAEGHFASRKGDFHLLFSDVMLPDGTGPELACRLTRSDPDLRVLLTTGYAGESLRTNSEECPDFACLRKPYSVTTLLSAIRSAIAP